MVLLHKSTFPHTKTLNLRIFLSFLSLIHSPPHITATIFRTHILTHLHQSFTKIFCFRREGSLGLLQTLQEQLLWNWRDQIEPEAPEQTASAPSRLRHLASLLWGSHLELVQLQSRRTSQPSARSWLEFFPISKSQKCLTTARSPLAGFPTVKEWSLIFFTLYNCRLSPCNLHLHREATTLRSCSSWALRMCFGLNMKSPPPSFMC